MKSSDLFASITAGTAGRAADVAAARPLKNCEG